MTEISKGIDYNKFNTNPSQRSNNDSTTLDNSVQVKDTSLESVPVYTFDETIQLVINEKRSFGFDMMFQNLSFVILTMGILSFNPV